jgi:hypothetical protein
VRGLKVTPKCGVTNECSLAKRVSSAFRKGLGVSIDLVRLNSSFRRLSSEGKLRVKFGSAEATPYPKRLLINSILSKIAFSLTAARWSRNLLGVSGGVLRAALSRATWISFEISAVIVL